MKASPILVLAVAGFLGVLPSQSESCSPLDNVKVTFFGYPDNSPPGAGIAWSNCGHSLAGGTGSYDDPITFATATDGDFKVCDVVYLPYLRKYARYEDDCEQCKEDWDSSKEYHIDLWTGSTYSNGGDTQVDCENSLTGGPQTIIRDPAKNLPTDTTPFFSDGNCNKKTYGVDEGGDLCTGTGSSTPVSSTAASSLSTTATTLLTSTTKKSGPEPTSCAWEGHCLGAPCETYNDCADPFVCEAGKCSSM